MKKLYHEKSKLNLYEGYGVILLCIITVIGSCVYAIYLQQKSTETFLLLNKYMEFEQNIAITWYTVCNTFYRYGKRILLIWIFGAFSFTIPLGIILLLIMIFSYGFTTASFILLYGVKGSLLAFSFYGVQAILMCGLGGYITMHSIDIHKIQSIKLKQQYISLILPSLLLISITAGIDLWCMSYFQSIKMIFLS